MSPRSVEAAWEWLESERDFLDGAEVIDLRPDVRGQRWLPIQDFQSFSGTGASAQSAHISLKTWRRLTCLVVREGDYSEALKHLEGQMLTGSHDLGFGNDTWTKDFLGEYGWRAETDDEWTREWARKWTEKPSPKMVMPPVEGRGLTFSLRQEASGYNFNLTQNLSVILPCPWLMRDLNMSLKDGRDLIYTDPKGAEIYKDPSAPMLGPSAGLIEREALLKYASQTSLIPIWVIGGGKELFSERQEELGQRWFTSIWTLEAGVFRRRSLAIEETLMRHGEGSDQER